MEVPFHRPYVTEEDIAAVTDVLKKGWITMGQKTVEFEMQFKSFVGCGEAVAVNSGTAALHLGLKVIGLKPGDEVILPAMTFAACAEAVCYFNARPVLLDVDPNTHLMDVEGIEKKITGKTKAVLPVHYGGQAVDMDRVMDIARSHNLAVVEDAAHAFPSLYKERMIGTIGDVTCFSFYATKPLTTGEGGMATTENPEWADRMRVLRLHGIGKHAWKRYMKGGTWRYDVLEPGYKYNTTDINAALGIEQLKKTNWMWERRKEIASRYNSAFTGVEEILPYRVAEENSSACHLYPLRLNIEALRVDRDRFILDLADRGVGTSVHFIPLYKFSAYRSMVKETTQFPGCEWVFDRVVSLPIYPGMGDHEIDHVCNSVLEILKKNKR